MTLFNELLKAIPELEHSDSFEKGIIILQDDSDGLGAFIAKWEYSKPIPEGLTLGKPQA